MKKKRFAEAVEKPAGAGEIRHVRENSDDTGSGFIDLAGSVDVPPKKKGTSWKAIKAATWRQRAMSRK